MKLADDLYEYNERYTYVSFFQPVLTFFRPIRDNCSQSVGFRTKRKGNVPVLMPVVVSLSIFMTALQCLQLQRKRLVGLVG